MPPRSAAGPSFAPGPVLLVAASEQGGIHHSKNTERQTALAGACKSAIHLNSDRIADISASPSRAKQRSFGANQMVAGST
jgi:hypothetical protein